MEYTESYQIPGILVQIDFEKDFNSVDRNFMSKVVKFFKFGLSMQKWIRTFFSDKSTNVL